MIGRGLGRRRHVNRDGRGHADTRVYDEVGAKFTQWHAAEPFTSGAPDAIALELYHATQAAPLPIETSTVRP